MSGPEPPSEMKVCYSKWMTKFFFTFALNGFALFGSVIGLYFFLSQYHLNPYLHLLVVLVVGAIWGVKSLLYFREEFARIVSERLSENKK